MTIAFRPGTLEDRTFVISTWASSYKRSDYAGIIHADDWAPIMKAQLTKILDRDGARSVVAYEKDDPGFFYGWIAGDTTGAIPSVYFVYVKEPYRRQGIARGLFRAFGVNPEKPFVYACSTDFADKLQPSHAPYARFYPDDVRYSRESRRRPL